jgi:hypothetical protein
MRVIALTGAFLARWRLELATILAILAAHHAIGRVIPDPWTTILILAAITGLVAWPRSRAVVTTGLWHARVRRAWTRAVIDTGAADPPPKRSRRPQTLHGPKARRVTDVLAGELVTVRIPRGHSVTTLEQRQDALAGCLRIKEVRITRDGDNARHCQALLIRRDPFADLTEIPWPNQDADTLSLRDPIPVGINDNGQPITVTLGTQHAALLLGGEPGAGKSVAISLFAATGALDPNARLWLIDGKRVELSAWAPCAQQIAHTPKEAADLLRRLREIMDDRYRELEVLGRRHVTPHDGLPLHLLICDELAFFTANENAADKKKFSDLLRDIVARGRAAGVLVVAATQKPSVDVVPSAIRDLFPFKLALRSNTPQASDTILGQGWAAAGADASTIPAGQRGVGHLLAEGARPERVKGYWLDDEGVSQIASRATGRHAEAWLAGTGRPATDTGLEQSDGTGGNTAPEKPASSPEPEDAG